MAATLRAGDPGADGRPATTGGPNATGGPSVASKIFAVLDAFDGTSTSLRLSTIAERTGLPMPTALRMVRELVGWGGLERQRDGSYRVGRRLWALGVSAPCVRRIRRAAAAPMRELCAVTGLEVHLAVLDGTEALVVDGFSGSAGHAGQDGERLPLHASAAGKVLLAHAPPSTLDAVLAAGLPRLTPYTIDAPGRLAGQLRRTRRTGTAFAYEETRLGQVAAAAPVREEGGGAVVAALGVTGASRTNLAAHTGALAKAAARTSRNLAAAFTG